MWKLVLFAAFLAVLAPAFSQKSVSLDDRIKNLQDSLLRRPVLKMNGDKFRQYVKGTPRNYSMIVMLTALAPGRGCQICKQAYEEYEIVANSFRYGYLNAKSLYFSLVDFDDAQDVFQMLNLNTAPVIMHFPPKGEIGRAHV